MHCCSEITSCLRPAFSRISSSYFRANPRPTRLMEPREKNAKFDERTIENENNHLKSMACEEAAVFQANEGWLGVGAYD